MIFKRIFILAGLFIWGACAGPVTKYETDADKVESEQRVLEGSFEKVWRATQLAMAEYPIRVNNQDSGSLETELIRSDQGFRVPGQERKGVPTGVKYRIVIRVFKSSGNTKSRIIVRKNVEVLRDFVSAPEKIPSDGLEELAIMYRVERELLIDHAANKANGDLDI